MNKKGFTIIEAIVSISIFIVVMVISVTALLSIIDANKKSHQLKSVMDNLNFAIETMTRNIRVGTTYVCGNVFVNSSDTATPNCTNFTGAQNLEHALSFMSQGSVQTVYFLSNNQIQEQIGSGSVLPLTDKQVHIDDMRFYVTGALPGLNASGTNGIGGGDGQPRVIMTVTGYAGTGKAQSYFHLQTSVTQRIYDY